MARKPSGTREEEWDCIKLQFLRQLFCSHVFGAEMYPLYGARRGNIHGMFFVHPNRGPITICFRRVRVAEDLRRRTGLSDSTHPR